MLLSSPPFCTFLVAIFFAYWLVGRYRFGILAPTGSTLGPLSNLGQLRFDVFNAFNHPRFPQPDTNPGSATFGRVPLQQQNQARAVELGARLTF